MATRSASRLPWAYNTATPTRLPEGPPMWTLLALPLVLLAPAGFAADRPTVELWPDGMPEPKVMTTGPEKVENSGGIARRSNVSKPRLVVFEAPAEKRTGAAAVVVPGGGFG